MAYGPRCWDRPLHPYNPTEEKQFVKFMDGRSLMRIAEERVTGPYNASGVLENL